MNVDYVDFLHCLAHSRVVSQSLNFLFFSKVARGPGDHSDIFFIFGRSMGDEIFI